MMLSKNKNKLVIATVLLLVLGVAFFASNRSEQPSIKHLSSSGLSGSDYTLDIERDLKALNTKDLGKDIGL